MNPQLQSRQARKGKVFVTILDKARSLARRGRTSSETTALDTMANAGFSGPRLARTASELGLPLSDVVILFACNDAYVPYLSVALQSIKETVSPARRYDIVILSHDITLYSMRMLHRQMSSANIGIGFLDVGAALGEMNLPQHGHFRTQMYYRLLAPELLNNVSKAVYLDSDLVILRDIAELYDTDVTGKLIAATQDADTIGQADGYEPTIRSYLLDAVGLKSPYDYFQSGVLVMNLELFRAKCPSEKLIELSGERHWQWPDQDVLNRVCGGDYVRVPMCWNTLMDWQHLRRSHIIAQAPEEVREAYEEARRNPVIIHYAGPDDRPWTNPNADMAEFFWAYAAESPFLGELEKRLHAYRHTAGGAAKRAQVFALYKVGMPLFDAVAPAGSTFRKIGVKLYRGVGLNQI